MNKERKPKKVEFHFDENSRVELLPCPFCGSKPILNSRHPDRINCSRPGCYQAEPWREYGMTVEDWNTRPLEDALRASLAAAQAENRRLTACLKRNSHDECNCKACVDVRETLKESHD